jgi:uncharacterized membrane protein
MKRLTEKHRQWAWFVALWAGGLVAVFMLAQALRWLMKIG